MCYYYYFCQVDIDQGGLDAVVKLSSGDMRKALNILQVIELDIFSL